MRDTARTARKAEIEAAAYRVLADKGFQNMSMLAVAKAAKASNETLYRWYGDKTGLFEALIISNAERVAVELQTYLDGAATPRAALSNLGPLLLEMLLSDRAIALNRAACADATGALGQVLAQEGRGRVFPLIVQLFELLQAHGVVRGTPNENARLYVDLLLGDLQIRRATGALEMLTKDAVTQRAKQAEARFLALVGGVDTDGHKL
ncbi:TetR/AcrR family transcriptional regulator [Marivita sp. S6314]|uniref:TetR/AcrR family transcriptional regulator n=1 Tax=Marivita sp. S6314 TaxID=2926406 RepID=UPI001FF585C6|nr:TetR/AcrR family transcriptional regulator [Marivita sp. S6314]MCK0149365.1 TetR/AcrR family transcriptional regulator [Marivita sp. S6314]